MKASTIFKRVGIAIGIFIVSTIVLLEGVRTVGRLINKKTPDGGINEDMMIDVNGTKQWISIYGQDLNNPVLLYLHGGPGGPTSCVDYKILRKYSDIYTVVSWDQRNCGKSYSESQNNITVTYDLLMQDGKEVTEFLLNYLKKDKISLLGHSWGTYYGSNLALAYPQYYEAYIGAGQLIDIPQNEKAMKDELTKLAKDDEDKKLLEKITLGHITPEYDEAKIKLMDKYDRGVYSGGKEINTFSVIYFNPYYSLIDIYKFFSNYDKWNKDYYMEFQSSDEINKFSLLNRTNYEVSYYNVVGDKDLVTNYLMAQEYHEKVTAPRKRLYLMKDMGHGLLFSRIDEFSDIIHDIYKYEHKSLNNTTSTNTTTTNNIITNTSTNSTATNININSNVNTNSTIINTTNNNNSTTTITSTSTNKN